MAMQQPRSGPSPTGSARPVRPRRSPDGGHGDGEDRFSDLPKELRLEVLVRLRCAREAARTSVLSTRWRRLWAELRDLTFDTVDPDSIAAALAMVVHPDLLRLHIRDYTSGDRKHHSASAARISSLLRRAAERLAPAELVVELGKYSDDDAPPLEMPCFGRAVSIHLFAQGRLVVFTLPRAGNLDKLEQLSLRCCGLLNAGAFLLRCPRLRKLEMHGSCSCSCPSGMKTLTVESMSLEELMLEVNHQTLHVDIVAPKLNKLTLPYCCPSGEVIISLSAPKLEEFHLDCDYISEHYSSVGSGDKWRLLYLKMATVWHGRGQLGPRVHDELVLFMSIQAFTRKRKFADAKRSFEQEVARLPVTNFSVLELSLLARGHDYGALVLQLLRIRPTIQRLEIRILVMFEECSENCDCGQASNWRNEQISLPDLEVVQLEDFNGADHEVDFLKLIFRSAPMLKRMSIKLSHPNKVSPNNRVCQELCSILEANVSVKYDVYDISGDKISF